MLPLTTSIGDRIVLRIILITSAILLVGFAPMWFGYIEVNALTSSIMVILGATVALTILGVLAAEQPPNKDSFEDYMKNLRDMLDR